MRIGTGFFFWHFLLHSKSHQYLYPDSPAPMHARQQVEEEHQRTRRSRKRRQTPRHSVDTTASHLQRPTAMEPQWTRGKLMSFASCLKAKTLFLVRFDPKPFPPQFWGPAAPAWFKALPEVTPPNSFENHLYSRCFFHQQPLKYGEIGHNKPQNCGGHRHGLRWFYPHYPGWFTLRSHDTIWLSNIAMENPL